MSSEPPAARTLTERLRHAASGSRGRPLIVLAALLLALVLRTWRLDHLSLWQDEGLSFYRASLGLGELLGGRIPLGDLVTRDVHPPFYFLLLGGWLRLLGLGLASTWGAKTLSLLASLPSIPLLWALGRRLLGRRGRGPALAALFGALSPAWLWYSQEVRSYSLLITLGLAAAYGLARLLESRPRGPWPAVTAIATGLMLWTHYLAFLLAAALGLAAVALRARGRAQGADRGQDAQPDPGPLPDPDPEAVTGTAPAGRLRALWPLLLAVLVALPLLPYAAWRLGLGAERHQHFVPLPVMLRDIVFGFALGRTVDQAQWPVWLLDAAFAAALILGLLRLWRRRRPSAVFLGAYLLGPVLLLFAVTTVKPVYLGLQHILMVSPAFYLLLAAGLDGAMPADAGAPPWRRRLPAAGLAVLLSGMLYADWNFYTEPAFGKDDHRALAAYVRERAAPGDQLAVTDPVLAILYRSLLPDLPARILPPLLPSGAADDRPPGDLLRPVLAELGRVKGRLWFVDGADDLSDWLSDHALHVDRQVFPAPSIALDLDAWEADPNLRTSQAPQRRDTVVLGPLSLLGWSWAGAPAAPPAGRSARLGLVWLVGTEGVKADLKVALTLRGPDGAVYGQGDQAPFQGLRPTHLWPAGETVFAPQDLAIGSGTPPGDYRLAARVYDAASGQAWPAEGPADLGILRVTRPDRPLGLAALAAAEPRADEGPLLPLVARGPGLDLVAWEPEAAPAGGYLGGGTVSGAAWLRYRHPLPEPCPRLRAELVDGWGRKRAATEVAVFGCLNRAPGDLHRLPLTLDLPAEAGRYSLRLGLLDGPGQPRLWRRGWPLAWFPVRAAWLETLSVEEPPRRTSLPPAARPVNAVIGDDQAALLAWEGPSDKAVLRGGQDLDVTLYWRGGARERASWNVTVQLLPLAAAPAAGNADEPMGPPAAQVDGAPAGGARPAKGWRADEVVADPHRLVLPPDLPPGRYLLIAAVYDPAAPGAARPFFRQDGAERDHVRLARLTVRARPPAAPEGDEAPKP